MLYNLKQIIETNFNFSPNHNQIRDIERLIFEIIRRENTSLQEIMDYLAKNSNLNKYSGRNKFFGIKDALIKRRFPLTSPREKIDTKEVFSNKLREPLKNNWQVSKEFKPLKVFIEQEVKNSYLVKNFRNKFPRVEMEEINYYNDYLKENKFIISELKKPLVFIVKERWDFIKPCPCTKYHLGCGYWILNLGFGCPFDCSYCFLQHYTNFPGIILPGNIEDFFTEFDSFSKKLTSPIRIGTGEFCDSLALDEITEYSQKLIPYLKNKKVFFELKTKSNKISNLLKIDSSSNIIISWSINPSVIVDKEDLGTASLTERLSAAKEVQEKGYRIGLHFDPIIHFNGWEYLYKEVIEKLYSQCPPPFAWISLGTLRSNRELKTISELRFPQSNIFYGELLLGEDKKLRYPNFLRKEIYKNMLAWIRNFDTKTPVYLCMEDKEIWEVMGKEFHSADIIENYLLLTSKF